MQTIIFIFIFILLGDFLPGFCVVSECPHCVELQKKSFNFPLQKCYFEYLLTQKHLFHILNKINIFQLYMCQCLPPITPFGQNCPLSSLKCKTDLEQMSLPFPPTETNYSCSPSIALPPLPSQSSRLPTTHGHHASIFYNFRFLWKFYKHFFGEYLCSQPSSHL